MKQDDGRRLLTPSVLSPDSNLSHEVKLQSPFYRGSIGSENFCCSLLDSTRKQASHPKGVRLRQLPYRILRAILGAEGNGNPRKYGGGGLTLGQTRTIFSSSAMPELHISSSYTCRLRITSIVLMIDPHNQPLSHRLLRGTFVPGSIGRGQLQVPISALVISPRNQPR